MELLTKVLSSIPNARRQAIQRMVADAVKRGEVTTPDEAVAKLDELVARVTGSQAQSIMKVSKAVAGSPVSSEDWNNMQNEIFVDLHSVYSETKAVGALSTAHSEIARSSLQESKAAINKAINDIPRS